MLAPIMNKSLDDQEKFYRQTNDDDVFDCVHCIMSNLPNIMTWHLMPGINHKITQAKLASTLGEEGGGPGQP